MIALFFCLLPALAGDARVECKLVENELVVDATGSSVAPAAFLRELAERSGRTLRGEDVLLGADPIDLHLHERPLDAVLRAVALATNASIAADAHTISVSPSVAPGHEHAKLEDLDLEAQAAWLRIVREFPDHEVARTARCELGRAQERLGHDDDALAHYDAAVRTDITSPAMERALQAASDLLARRGEWGESQRRLSMLAVHAASESVRAAARVATARALAMQRRGPESLALLEAVDLSYPPRSEREMQDRRLVRARAHLALGDANSALRELDARAAAHEALGFAAEDLELRARALELAGAPLEASRAWLACASCSSGVAKEDALTSAARLALAGGDELAVVLIARLAQGGAASARIERMADEVRQRLRLDLASADTIESLEKSWKERARLAPADRAQLAARCVSAMARGRSVQDAAEFARTALAELAEFAGPDGSGGAGGSDGAPIRAALAASYERRGQWSDAARVWSGGSL